MSLRFLSCKLEIDDSVFVQGKFFFWRNYHLTEEKLSFSKIVFLGEVESDKILLLKKKTPLSFNGVGFSQVTHSSLLPKSPVWSDLRLLLRVVRSQVKDRLGRQTALRVKPTA